MKFTFNVSKEININGKKYGSVDEMPADVRTTFASAVSVLRITDKAETETKFVYNGQEYKNPDEMPPEIRKAYDAAMVEVQKRLGHAGAIPAQSQPAEVPGRTRATSFERKIPAGAAKRQPNWFVIGLVCAALAALIYSILHG